MVRGILATVFALILLAAPAWAQFGDSDIIAGAKNGDVNLARNAIIRGEPVNKADVYRTTALMHAAANGHAGVVNLLLEHKASLVLKNDKGATALILAAEGGHLDVVRILLDSGADINTPDKQGFTPLISAVRRGHVSVVQELIDRKADLKKNDYTGLSALDWAERSRHSYIADLIRNAGAG